jgi:hypothetical protein
MRRNEYQVHGAKRGMEKKTGILLEVLNVCYVLVSFFGNLGYVKYSVDKKLSCVNLLPQRFVY